MITINTRNYKTTQLVNLHCSFGATGKQCSLHTSSIVFSIVSKLANHTFEDGSVLQVYSLMYVTPVFDLN